jgi:hypothetical protein
MDLSGALEWLAANAQDGGNYTIVLDKDQAISPAELDYPNKTVSVTLKCAGGKHTVKFADANPAASLFVVRDGVTFTLEAGITLEGAQNNTESIVRVAGGTLVMNGAALTGNKTKGSGGGVYVAYGRFSMYNSAITKNTAINGGGVYVAAGGFTMENSDISGNSSSDGGGGVYLAYGTFTMSGGTISSNTANNNGGGIYINEGVFIMNGGIISGNTASGRSYNTGDGGGVRMTSGAFTMRNGTISGNTAKMDGGGVSVAGTFTISGGTISGNIASGGGGGVWMSGTFTMSNGTITGNTANGSKGGGGVYVAGTFTKTGGVIHGSNAPEAGQANQAKDDSAGHAVAVGDNNNRISKKRNNTARAGTAMDSGKDGPPGGWE